MRLRHLAFVAMCGPLIACQTAPEGAEGDCGPIDEIVVLLDKAAKDLEEATDRLPQPAPVLPHTEGPLMTLRAP